MAEFLGIRKSHKIVFSDLEFGSRVSRNDYVSSCGSDYTCVQSIRTLLELS
ncbi:hypothetical protein YC2023_060919 [Brassica napus]